jgi:hypothetical protein
MTYNNDYNLNKASLNWIEAYKTTNYPDMEAFENYSTQFLSQVNDPTIDADDLICTLCMNTFSAVAFSSMVKRTTNYTTSEEKDSETNEEEIPVLSIVLHPFKESRALSFGGKERLFGIYANRSDPTKDSQVVEFVEPLESFSFLKIKSNKNTPESEEEEDVEGVGEEETGRGIVTPSFKDFFDDTFADDQRRAEPYQPLNNATEIPPVNVKQWFKDTKDNQETSGPKPFYIPRKVIPLSPTMVRIIWENGEYNFSGIINGIRENAWEKIKVFKNKESRLKYLFLVYRTIQAFWVHGQHETDTNSAMKKFIRCGTEFMARISSFRWALDKGNSTTEALALYLGNLKNYTSALETDESVEQDNENHGYPPEIDRIQGNRTDNRNKHGVRFRTNQDPNSTDDTKDLILVARDMVATMINKGANRDSEYIQENSWAYKAVRLASSKSNHEAATRINTALSEITKLGDKHARDSIAHDINQLRKANVRIDKVMATNIRSCQVFRLNPASTGNMSFFHCYPRKPDDLQQGMMTGEELEMKVKLKVVTAKTVMELFESKLGSAESAQTLKKQAFNFWQYNGFMFGDEAYVTLKMKEVHDTIEKLENEIESLAENDDDYILLIAGIINNEYHLFLSSCIDANEDIGQVEWEHIDEIAKTIRGFVKARTKPTFVLPKVIRQIYDQTKRELATERKRKYDDDRVAIGIGGNPNADNHLKRLKKNNGKGAGNEYEPEREVDPEKSNDNVRKDWKMSANEFRRVLGEHMKSCPTLEDGKSICAMYNIVGRCYFGSKCHHSHDELPDNIAKEMDDWINDCRKKAKDSPKNKNGKRGPNKKD